MNTETNVEHFIHALGLYAKTKGWSLSKYAKNIVNRSVNFCGGKCPCAPERGFCPCSEHEKEVEANGQCHCTLFVNENANNAM